MSDLILARAENGSIVYGSKKLGQLGKRLERIFCMRGWMVILDDETRMFEGQHEWREVPKKRIRMLSLLFDGRRWNLTDKDSYFVKTSASMIPGISESFMVEGHCIGYYEGNRKIHYYVDGRTGKFKMYVTEN